MEKRQVDPKDRQLVWDTVLDATQLVGRPVFFSMAIIILAFIPVFALTGQEGKLFHPLAFTKTFAMVGATIMAVTLVPVLCTLLLGGKFHKEEDNPVMRFLQWIYKPLLRFALTHRLLAIATAAFFLAIALLLATSSSWLAQARLATANIPILSGIIQRMHPIGNEFMPTLDEGDIMFMPVTDTSVSLPQALEITSKQDAIIKSFPEVEWAVGKPGRAETSTDPSPTNMIETVIHLKPRDQWRAGMTREKLIAEMDAKVSMPGVTNIWTQPIRNRIDMLSTGIRTQVGLKIFGNDLKTLEARAQAAAKFLNQIPADDHLRKSIRQCDLAFTRRLKRCRSIVVELFEPRQGVGEIRFRGFTQVSVGRVSFIAVGEVRNYIEAKKRTYSFLKPANVERLFKAYGTDMEKILGNARFASDLGRFFGPISEREVEYLRDNEWVTSADDILWRRSKLGLHMSADEQNALRACVSGSSTKKPKKSPKS